VLLVGEIVVDGSGRRAPVDTLRCCATANAIKGVAVFAREVQARDGDGLTCGRGAVNKWRERERREEGDGAGLECTRGPQIWRELRAAVCNNECRHFSGPTRLLHCRIRYSSNTFAQYSTVVWLEKRKGNMFAFTRL
jgi:hypothetical protein